MEELKRSLTLSDEELEQVNGGDGVYVPLDCTVMECEQGHQWNWAGDHRNETLTCPQCGCQMKPIQYSPSSD